VTTADIVTRYPPTLDASKHAPRDRAIAATAWRGLLAQEERSRLTTARLVKDLVRAGAPVAVLECARRVAADEARHVEICAQVIRALGHVPETPALVVPELPEDDRAFEGALAEILVAGFAVAETMSVGGFVAVRATAREPLVRWALAQIARDEVGHGRFGEFASAWAIGGWSRERRVALWPACVRAMEEVERRAGGPVGALLRDARAPGTEALGVPSAYTTGMGLMRAVPKAVLPRLARLGVLPACR